MGAADQHFFNAPAGSLGNNRFGLVGHLTACADGVDERNDSPPFTVLKSDRADMHGVVNIARRARSQLDRENGG